MKKGGVGGNKTVIGLNFEKKVDLYQLFSRLPTYQVKKQPPKAGFFVYYDNALVGRCFKKHEFYKFLEENNIDWKQIISKNAYLMTRC